MISVSPRGLSWIYVPLGVPGVPPPCSPAVLLPVPIDGDGCVPGPALFSACDWITPLGCPGLPVSPPCGVALGAVLALALPSLAAALDGDGLGEDAAAVCCSLLGDVEGLDSFCGVVGVGEGAGLDCGRSETSGTASLGASIFNAGAEGVTVGAGAATGVTGTGA